MEKPACHAHKCYLTPEGRGLITCPSCGFGKCLDFKDTIPANRNVRIRCRCGMTFKGLLEIRQHYRKHVKLRGEYANLSSMRSGGMVVENVSRWGIGFRVSGFEYFKKGDPVTVAFELNNGRRSRISADGLVKHVQGNFVGFRINGIREGEKELGFYLMP